jgi:acetylcholinesterase/cholinesterase
LCECRTYAEYITPAVLLAEELHCAASDISCLRRQTYQDIATAQTKVNTKLTSFNFLLFFEPWVPVIDNKIVKGQLLDVVKNTSFPLKPLMIGTLTEEAVFYIYEAWSKPVSLELYIEALLFTFHEKAIKVFERYPPNELDDQRPLMSRLATHWVFSCATRIFARKASSYSYVFGFPLDFDGWENETFCNNHTCHAGELPYTFQSAWINFTDAGKRVATSMGTYWTNFAKSFDPNQPISPTMTWPKTTSDEPYLYFQDPLDLRKDYLKDECDFWDTIGYKAKPFKP